jgi:hypothetical protein
MRRFLVGLSAIIALAVLIAAASWMANRSTNSSVAGGNPAAGSAKAILAPSASPADDGNWTIPRWSCQSGGIGRQARQQSGQPSALDSRSPGGHSRNGNA